MNAACSHSMTAEQYLFDSWCNCAGVAERPIEQRGPSELRVLTYTPERAAFERAMLARMVQGCFRYADLGYRSDEYPIRRLVSWTMQRLHRYLDTGDAEQLIDAGNGCCMAHERHQLGMR